METYMELETLNTMEPIWKRQKSKVKPEDYNEYYKGKFGDYEDPVKIIRTSVEGVSSYTALLFIPGHTPYDYYTKDYEKRPAAVFFRRHDHGKVQGTAAGLLQLRQRSRRFPGSVAEHQPRDAAARQTTEEYRQEPGEEDQKELLDFLKEDREGYEKVL